MAIIKTFKFFLYILISLGLLTTQAFSNDTFSQFIIGISNEAEKKGISFKLIRDFKNKVTFIPRVIELDKSQPEFKLTLDQYLARVVTS